MLLGLASVSNVALGAGANGDVNADAHERAVTNFEAGRRLFEKGDCKAAIPRFRESLRAEASVGARFNLAACSKSEGDIAAAWNHFKAAEQLALAKADDAERARAALDEASVLEPQVAKLRLALPKGKLTVRVDGVEVLEPDLPTLTTGYAVRPDTEHTIEVQAPGFLTWTQRGFRGKAGVEMPAYAVVLTPEPNPTSPLIPVSIAVAGLGLVGVGTGVAFGLVANARKSDFDVAVADPANGCGPDRQTCNALVRERRDAVDGPATLSTIGFIAGGVLLATGVTLFVLAPRGKSAPQTAVVLRPGGGALMGTF